MPNPYSSSTQGQTIDASSTIQTMFMSNLNGVEGMPYQFMDSVDRRIQGTAIGRKYGEKIISRIPLLFLTPCKPVFMDDFGDSDKSNVANMILAGQGSSDLINGKGRYYSLEYDYTDYYTRLNIMLSAVLSFLGLWDQQFKINGVRRKLGDMDWGEDVSSSFKSFFSSRENLVFYLDGMNSVSESFSNDTTESSLASQINGYSDTANEIQFLFGNSGGAISALLDNAKEATSSITSSLSGALGNIGGGIVGSLADTGVNTVLNGGKIVFPEIWSNSSYDKSYSIELKLRSPDHDSLSIFMNVLKPYCKILNLALPHLMEKDEFVNPNGYMSPYLVKAYCKGMFSIDYGIISSISATKGAECCWNDDGLPTQIDLSIEIKDLYHSLATSSSTDGIKTVVNNTAYMDFLANMAGLNIAQMEIGKRITMYYYLTRTNLSTLPSRTFSKFEQSISQLMGNMYDKL